MLVTEGQSDDDHEMNTTSTTRRGIRQPSVSVGALAAATAVALATAVMAPATANAQDSSAIPDLFPAQNRLIATGGSPTGACYGVVTTTISPDGYPGTASVGWAFGVLGLSACDLTVTLSWRNLDTGATGEKIARVPVPRISGGVPDPISHPYAAIMSTGAGPVEYRLTTNGGAVAGPVTITTPAYAG